MSEELADILAGSRESIEERGWGTGEFVDENGHLCAIGGVLTYLGLEEGQCQDPRVVAVAQALIQAGHLPVARQSQPHQTPSSLTLFSVTMWNDQKANEQKVLDLFAKAEKIERAGFDPDAP